MLASPTDPEDEGEGAPAASRVAGTPQSAGPAIDGETSDVQVQEQEQQQGHGTAVTPC